MRSFVDKQQLRNFIDKTDVKRRIERVTRTQEKAHRHNTREKDGTKPHDVKLSQRHWIKLVQGHRVTK